MTTKFSVEDVVKAYEKCGWTPTDGEFINKEAHSCCPLSALCMVDLDLDEVNDEVVIKWAEDKIPGCDNSFMYAVDGLDNELVEELCIENVEQREYYLLGIKVRQELKLDESN